MKTIEGNVLIRGDGIAASCSARLLQQAGMQAAWNRPERPRVPAIMLSGGALALIGDVFGPLEGFSDLHRIRRRVVLWNNAPSPITVEHAAVVISERALLEAVETHLSPAPRRLESVTSWSILTSPPLPPETKEQHFGNRRACAVSVTLRDRADSSACWVESVQAGWLFLIPTGPNAGYLLAVGDQPEALLESSRLIAQRIEQLCEPAGEFPAHPRLTWPLCGSGWLACGSAAMGFDPLCGDGTAQSIREAILASAVVQSLSRGESAAWLLSEYQARLTAGLSRHLLLCEEFYRTGGEGRWWKRELHATREGAKWCAKRVGEQRGFRYQLQGYELQALA